jgi:hypothetical protein
MIRHCLPFHLICAHQNASLVLLTAGLMPSSLNSNSKNKNKNKNIYFIGLNIGSSPSGYIEFVAARSTINTSEDTLHIWTYHSMAWHLQTG